MKAPVRYALTVWQPWASLIVHGLKPIEFRGGWPPRFLVSHRIVIHAGAPDPRKAILELLTSDDAIRGSCGHGCDVPNVREALDRMLSRLPAIPRKAGIGTAILGAPEKVENMWRRLGWRLEGEGPWNNAWPMLEAKTWDEPVPMRGAQGFWKWPS